VRVLVLFRVGVARRTACRRSGPSGNNQLPTGIAKEALEQMKKRYTGYDNSDEQEKPKFRHEPMKKDGTVRLITMRHVL
ncbi:hypothetical protein OEZ81_25805, partial [Leclercia adecarboxylata]|uniref:hypothetical protein n=1 Tax=Leclercia adecarboxylata TaxID=83655 RepID=UPI00234D8586